MFIEACIACAGLHYGGKLFKKIKNRQNDKNNRIYESALSLKPARKDITKLPAEKNRDIDPEAEINKNLTVAAFTSGLTIAGIFYPPLTFLGVTALIYSGIPFFKKALKAIFKEKRPRIEIFETISVLAALASGYYVITGLLATMYFVSEKLRFKTENNVKRKILDIFADHPESVWIIKNDTEVSVPFESLQKGDIVVVNAGEVISADGEIVYGKGSVDQSMLTGESRPVEKETVEKVFAGTILIAGRLHIRAKQTGEKTVAAKIGEILQNTAEFTKHIESEGKEVADKSVIPFLALSLGAFPFIGQIGTVALLSSNYLVNMRIAAPLGILNFLGMASEKGILIKDGRSFQLLSGVDTVVFDKTGTLTVERPQVSNIYTFNSIKENKVLELAAAAEYRQTHPIAQSVIEEASRRKIDIPQIDEADYKTGYGISVKIENNTVKAGSERFMRAENIFLPEPFDKTKNKIYERGNSFICIALDNAAVGVIELEPSIRPEAEDIIKKLKKLNMKLYILSGDHENPTKKIAEKLNFDGWFAKVLPKDKADIIDKLQRKGKKVCFIGDGINDSIALKKANVSVSMKGASTAATDSAQIVLMDKSLEKLPLLFDIAKKFQDNMKDTFWAVNAPSLFCIGGVFFAHFTILSASVLYGVSLASGMAVVSLPALKRKI